MPRPQKNNCDYFPHDGEMRNHRKVKAIRSKFGLNGYAMWCMFIEFLTTADGNVFENTDIEKEMLAGDFGVSVTDISSLLDYCIQIELLFNADGFIYSETLNERLAPVYQKRGRSKELSKKQLRVNGKFSNNNTVTDGVSVTEKPQRKVKESKGNKINKDLSTTVDGEIKNEFEKSILGIIQSIKSEFKQEVVKEYKITPKRIRMIALRKKEFHKAWGADRDFLKACKFAFAYKAKEWFGKPSFQYFEPETLLSEKFINYLEKAEQDKGEPYVPEVKKEEKVTYTIPK